MGKTTPVRMPGLTLHARSRFDERFPAFSADAELASSVLWRKLRNGERYLRSPCGAVFVQDGLAISTTLTMEQAMGTLSRQQNVVR
jgi:hypothetical protein